MDYRSKGQSLLNVTEGLRVRGGDTVFLGECNLPFFSETVYQVRNELLVLESPYRSPDKEKFL